MPPNSVIADHMSKEACNVAKTVCLIAMNGVVVFGEGRLKEIRPQSIDLGKSLTNQAVEFGECAFLGAALDDH